VVKKLEEQIDQMVYNLPGLSADEIAIVEGGSLVSLIAKRYYIVSVNAAGPVKISGFCP
jgi:hypothetical protein